MNIIVFLLSFIQLVGSIHDTISPTPEKPHDEMGLDDLRSYLENPFLIDKLKQSTAYHLVDFVWVESDDQYSEDNIQLLIAQPNISVDSIQRGLVVPNTYIEEGIDSLGRPLYINFWNGGMINSTLADVPDRVVFIYKRDFIVVIQFQNFMAYNGPSSRANAAVDVLKVELVYADNEITSCDITPFLGEHWGLTTDITKVSYTKITEIPFYQFTHLAFDPESNVKENNNIH